MLSSLVFRVIRDALPGNPAAQERILGASLLAMAIADVSYPRDHNEVPLVDPWQWIISHRQPSKLLRAETSPHVLTNLLSVLLQAS